MTNIEKNKLELEKKQFSLKNMYFNRYLAVRYLTAGFFFTNLNWLGLLLLAGSKWLWLPLLLMIAVLPAVAEQVRLYQHHENVAPRTNQYFRLQLIINILLAAASFSPLFQSLFPFMAQNDQGRLLVLAITLVGILLSVLIQQRLKKISTNHDQQYVRIQQYEKALQLGRESN